MSEVISDSDDTRRLLEESRAGDPQAFDALVMRHHAYLHQIVDFRLSPHLRSRVDVSDVVQEAHLEATRRIADYLSNPTMPFRLWLRQLACDRVKMMERYHLRAAKRSRFREQRIPERSSLLLAQQLLAGDRSPSEEVNHQELIQRVRQAIASLPEMDRQVLIMRTFEGLSFEEVGYLLQIENAAARKRHGRALLRLHKLLADEGLTESEL